VATGQICRLHLVEVTKICYAIALGVCSVILEQTYVTISIYVTQRDAYLPFHTHKSVQTEHSLTSLFEVTSLSYICWLNTRSFDGPAFKLACV
jgi:hypothetical protein